MQRKHLHPLLLGYVTALHVISFFLPVDAAYHSGGPIPNGWEVFVQIFTHYSIDDMSRAIGFVTPNVLFWTGLICLWRRHFACAFMLGLFATVSAFGWMTVFGFFDLNGATDMGKCLRRFVGAYVWLASMFALLASGWLLCHLSLTELKPQLVHNQVSP